MGLMESVSWSCEAIHGHPTSSSATCTIKCLYTKWKRNMGSVTPHPASWFTLIHNQRPFHPTPMGQGTPLVIVGLTLGPLGSQPDPVDLLLRSCYCWIAMQCFSTLIGTLTTAEAWAQISAAPPPCSCSLYADNHTHVCCTPHPSHLMVNSIGYHHYSCSMALHKAGPQSVDTESGHWVPSFIQGFKTPRGRHERHPRILLLSWVPCMVSTGNALWVIAGRGCSGPSAFYSWAVCWMLSRVCQKRLGNYWVVVFWDERRKRLWCNGHTGSGQLELEFWLDKLPFTYWVHGLG